MSVTIADVEIPDHMITTGVEVPEGMGFLSVPDATGDTRLMWDPNNREDTKVAEETFNNLRRRGHMVYKVDPEGGERTGEVLTSFPKKEGKLIAVKQMQGG